jgi:hypothetical protein
MKLAVPFLEVCDVPDELILDMLGEITEDDWRVKDYRKDFGNLGACDSILLRHSPLCGDGACQDNDRAIADIKNQPLHDKFSSALEPFLELMRKHYVFNEYASFIARMPAKSEVGMHCDGGNFLTKCHRIHFPLQTNPRVAYCIEDQEYYWQRGKAYEFDNTRLHGVKNRSDEVRIHLVVNLYNIEAQA